MKTFLKIFALLLALFLAGFIGYSLSENNSDLFGSLNEESQIITYEYAKSIKCEPNSSSVKPIGRTVFENGIRYFSMSGSGIEFLSDASYADVTLVCNAESLTANHRPRVAVYINDSVVFDETLSENETSVHLELDSYGEENTVKIIKLSESMHSACGVGEITVYGKSGIKPAKDKDLKIEFIGDSITAGFGIDEERENAEFSTATQNFSKTYAYLTAEALGADYSAVAFSGYGVVSGYTSSYYQNSKAVITEYYESSITNQSFESPYPLEKWDFSQFVPDVVVINLGVNDAVYCSTQTRREEFVEKYKKLIGLVRWYNKSSHILCVLGDVNDSLYPYIEQAVNDYTHETQDRAVSSFQLHYNMAENGSVIDGHPSDAAHQSAASELTEIIRNIISIEN